MPDNLAGLSIGQSIVVFPSLTRSVTLNSTDLNGDIGDFLHVIIDCTVKDGAAPSVVFTIQGKDRASGKYYTLLVSAAITAVGTTVLRIGPGLTAAANVAANDFVPSIWRVIATHGNADLITYSVGANFG